MASKTGILFMLFILTFCLLSFLQVHAGPGYASTILTGFDPNIFGTPMFTPGGMVECGGPPNNPNIYSTNRQWSNIVRFDLDSRSWTVIAGFPNTSYSSGFVLTSGSTNSADPFAARFNSPRGLACITNTTTGAALGLAVADTGNNAIRFINFNANNTVTTLAGSTSGSSGLVNAIGTTARFRSPHDITWLPRAGPNQAGALFVADRTNSRIRMLHQTATGWNVTSYVGGATAVNTQPTPGAGANAAFCSPNAIAGDPIRNMLYVADGTCFSIVAVNASDPWVGNMTTIPQLFFWLISSPRGVAFDPIRNIVYASIGASVGSPFLYSLDLNKGPSAESYGITGQNRTIVAWNMVANGPPAVATFSSPTNIYVLTPSTLLVADGTTSTYVRSIAVCAPKIQFFNISRGACVSCPVLSSISPASGGVSGDYFVTITGQNMPTNPSSYNQVSCSWRAPSASGLPYLAVTPATITSYTTVICKPPTLSPSYDRTSVIVDLLFDRYRCPSPVGTPPLSFLFSYARLSSALDDFFSISPSEASEASIATSFTSGLASVTGLLLTSSSAASAASAAGSGLVPGLRALQYGSMLSQLDMPSCLDSDFQRAQTILGGASGMVSAPDQAVPGPSSKDQWMVNASIAINSNTPTDADGDDELPENPYEQNFIPKPDVLIEQTVSTSDKDAMLTINGSMMFGGVVLVLLMSLGRAGLKRRTEEQKLKKEKEDAEAAKAAESDSDDDEEGDEEDHKEKTFKKDVELQVIQKPKKVATAFTQDLEKSEAQRESKPAEGEASLYQPTACFKFCKMWARKAAKYFATTASSYVWIYYLPSTFAAVSYIQKMGTDSNQSVFGLSIVMLVLIAAALPVLGFFSINFGRKRAPIQEPVVEISQPVSAPVPVPVLENSSQFVLQPEAEVEAEKKEEEEPKPAAEADQDNIKKEGETESSVDLDTLNSDNDDDDTASTIDDWVPNKKELQAAKDAKKKAMKEAERKAWKISVVDKSLKRMATGLRKTIASEYKPKEREWWFLVSITRELLLSVLQGCLPSKSTTYILIPLLLTTNCVYLVALLIVRPFRFRKALIFEAVDSVLRILCTIWVMLMLQVECGDDKTYLDTMALLLFLTQLVLIAVVVLITGYRVVKIIWKYLRSKFCPVQRTVHDASASPSIASQPPVEAVNVDVPSVDNAEHQEIPDCSLEIEQNQTPIGSGQQSEIKSTPDAEFVAVVP